MSAPQASRLILHRLPVHQQPLHKLPLVHHFLDLGGVDAALDSSVAYVLNLSYIGQARRPTLPGIGAIRSGSEAA